MKYVKVDLGDDGVHHLDPNPYLQELSKISAGLPGGARKFAEDPGRYDFFGRRCVRDLRIEDIEADEVEGYEVDMEIRFKGTWKHDGDLLVRYRAVSRFSLDVDPDRLPFFFSKPFDVGRLQLDEILPLERGCSHEVQFIGGRLLVECRDLAAEWVVR
ncbi:hypothetical protein ACQEU3_39065 [Spirillospora sp. CA-253888]